MSVDFGRTSADYSAYRPTFARRLYTRLADEFGIGSRGQDLLDVGAGTGLFSTPLAQRGVRVISLDVSHALVRSVASRAVVADASRLPFSTASFDVVTAAQCWHWLDRRRAPAQIGRVLRRNGRIAIVYQTYVPMPGTVAELTERLILARRPRWSHANAAGINGQALRDLQAGGFRDIESFSFDEEITFTRASWSGYVRTMSAVGPSMSPTELKGFDEALAEALSTLPEPLAVPHRVFAVVARAPRGGL